MRGFVAGNGSSYSPSLVRLGNKSAISLDVQAISLEGQLEETLAVNRDPARLPPGVVSLARALQRRKNETRIQNVAVEELQKAVHCAWATHADIAAAIRAQGAPLCAAPRWSQAEHSTAHGDLASADAVFKSYAHTFVVQTERLLRLQMEQERLALLARDNATRGDAARVPPSPFTVTRRCKDAVRRTIIDAADIVFTTLSSSALGVLEECNVRPFDVVVIDEAAQSIELDCLIPMRFNSKHCVLVGDPQQLPAVVKAKRAKAARYDRSLFERLAEVRPIRGSRALAPTLAGARIDSVDARIDDRTDSGTHTHIDTRTCIRIDLPPAGRQRSVAPRHPVSVAPDDFRVSLEALLPRISERRAVRARRQVARPLPRAPERLLPAARPL